MPHLTQLSQADETTNALAFLQSTLASELGKCTLAMVNTLNLDEGQFQISTYCNGDYCPTYNTAELLRPSTGLGTYKGHFIDSWKSMTSPQRVQKEECAELFQGNLAHCEDILILPILLDGKIERWVLVLKAEFDLNKVDFSKLSLLVNFAVISLARAEEKKQLEEITNWREQELKEISRLQHLLLPEMGTSIPGIEIAFKFEVYKEAGGDYFDIGSLMADKSSTAPHKFGAVIADVTGHGPSAAVEAAMLDAILRTFQPEDDTATPADVLEYANTHFFTRKHRGKFVTAITFTYDPTSRVMCYAAAGHPYGYIKRGSEVIRLDQSEDIPVGVLKEYQWKNYEVILEPQDIIFVYTDVVLETRNPDNKEFGFERLEETISKADTCPHCVVEDVASELARFSGAEELCDDLTLCSIQIKE